MSLRLGPDDAPNGFGIVFRAATIRDMDPGVLMRELVVNGAQAIIARASKRKSA